MEIKLFFEKSLLRDFFRINILTINLVSKLKRTKMINNIVNLFGKIRYWIKYFFEKYIKIFNA